MIEIYYNYLFYNYLFLWIKIKINLTLLKDLFTNLQLYYI